METLGSPAYQCTVYVYVDGSPLTIFVAEPVDEAWGNEDSNLSWNLSRIAEYVFMYLT